MIKIVHCADMHFDTPFADLPHELAEIRRGELLSAFEKTIDITAEFAADTLLIAGDVFENEYVSYQTVEFLKRCFAKIPDIPVFIAPGNHDAISENEIYKNIDLGANVHIFGEGISCYNFNERGFRVYGHGFVEKYENSSYWNGFSCPDDGLVNLFVGHCSLPPYSEERFSPLTYEQIEKTGLHYFASGHIHNHEGFKSAGKTVCAFSGIPEGRNFDETGEKGIIMGEVSVDSVSLNFVPVCTRQFITLRLDVGGCLTYQDIVAKTDFDKKNIYRIILTGERAEGISFDVNAVRTLLSEKAFYVKVIDETRDNTHTEPGIMENEFLKRLAGKRKSKDILTLAAKYGTAALRGKPFDDAGRTVSGK